MGGEKLNERLRALEENKGTARQPRETRESTEPKLTFCEAFQSSNTHQRG